MPVTCSSSSSPARHRRLRLALWLAVMTAVLGGRAVAAQPRAGEGPGVAGTVTVSGPDGSEFVLPGVVVLLRAGTTDGAILETTVSEPDGRYALTAPAPGPYVVEATLDGFAPSRVEVRVGPEAATQDLRLDLAGVQETVTVTASGPDSAPVRESSPPAVVTQASLQSAPLASEQVAAALPLVPGVIRGPDGLLNMKGGRESQSGLRVNGANVTDPVTGQFSFRLPLESVESLEVLSSPYSAEFGGFSGAMTTLQTRAGGERWRVQVQNFMPRVRRRGGTIAGLEAFTPRVAVGGPLADGVQLFTAVEYRLTQSRVEGLPPLESDIRQEGGSAFGQLDWQLGQATHLTTALAVFPQDTDFVGLDSFTPQSVTPNLEQRGYLWTASDRHVMGTRSFWEFHVSAAGFAAEVAPQADGDLVLAPDGNLGRYFSRATRDARRLEMSSAYTFTPELDAGRHVIKFGGGLTHGWFDSRIDSRPVHILDANGRELERIVFGSAVSLEAAKTETFAYAQDQWEIDARLTLDYGLRYDLDSTSDRHRVAPRAGFAWQAPGTGGAVVRGGAGLFTGRINLNQTAFDQRQPRTGLFFVPGATEPSGAVVRPLVTAPGGLEPPRSVAWNVEIDRELTPGLLMRVGYQQRENRHEAIVVPLDGPIPSLRLASTGRSRYREFEVTARYRHARVTQLVASYVRSRATGDLN
ncbi:MAG: TonB-dependent receptor, partial [Vicinamibacterales bacterium]